MVLLLAAPTDFSALWLRARLQSRGVPVRQITPAQLVYAQSISHRFSSRGAAACFVLATGEEIELSTCTAIINRISALPIEHLRARDPAELNYAQSELHAFMLGLLASLPCQIINAPAPEALHGAHHQEIHSLQLAAQAGLHCAPASCSQAVPIVGNAGRNPEHNYFVLDGKVIGPVLPPSIRDALVQFGSLWGVRLLQVDLDAQNIFCGATSLVDFRLGGEALISALVRTLRP